MDQPQPNSRLKELYGLVAQIPAGRVTSYAALGRALTHPVSGFLVGKWMAVAPDGVPWWRVIKANGEIALFKRDPALGMEQVRKLREEDVPFLLEHQVAIEEVFWDPDDAGPAESTPGSVY